MSCSSVAQKADRLRPAFCLVHHDVSNALDNIQKIESARLHCDKLRSSGVLMNKEL